ncbi:hypothetical protein O7627_36865 [Solwaraspora sp. WMMD1047]|uniref:hypothetical protein n=1 Tax=Solwaraspora sp. WMMD1047 TaxID=3016102 RepID=UPI002415C2BC|nr:hypothetical protein [Solwaraspora sp. WMMD1047]MDG4834843.1 hypothetical protein [Solwaraspora sp. WMMD1047]
MDPISIGVAVVALLGAKAAEGFATQAGSQAWQAVQRLGALVRGPVSPIAADALERLQNGAHDEEMESLLVGELAASFQREPALKASVEAILDEVKESPALATIMAVARDSAKQVNIGGNNTGSISL